MKRDRDPRPFADVPDPFDVAAATVAPAARRPEVFAPARARVRLVRGIALAIVLVYEAFWLAVLKTHAGDRPSATIALGFFVPLVAGAFALGAAIRRGARGLGEPVAAIAAATLGALFLFVGATLLVAPADARGAFWPDVVRCIGVSSLFAAGPLAIGFYAFRGAFASASTWRALALGTACGALATVMMSVVCSTGGQFHVLVGHGLTMVLGGAVGGFFGRRLARA
jgi:hypothetical protein